MRMNKAAYDGPDVATRTGPFVKYVGRGGTYVLAKKGGQGSGKHSQAVRDNRALFAEVTALMHFVDGDTYQWCRDQAKGTLYLPRDILAKLIYGTLMRFEMIDGTYKIGVRMVANDIQKMLDGISQDVGAVLVRTKDGWAAIEPGTANQVLAIDAASNLPLWRNETSSAPEAQAALDQISSVEGSMLYRSDGAWSAIAPGNSGQFLRLDPQTNIPVWASVVLNAEQFSESLDGMSDKPGSMIIRTAEKWTPLEPGTAGQFYVIDPVTGFPNWKSVDLGNVQANAALNALSTDIGAIVMRGESQWVGVAPGATGNVLTSRGQGETPYWAAPTGGQGGATAERLPAQVTNTGGATNEAMWQRTFEPGEISNGKSSYRVRATFKVLQNASSAGVGMHIGTTNLGTLIGNNAQTGWVYTIDCTLTQYENAMFYDLVEIVMVSNQSQGARFEYTGEVTVLPEQGVKITADAIAYNALGAGVVGLQALTFEVLG